MQKLINNCDFTAAAPAREEDYDYKKPVLGTYYGQFCFLNTLFPDRKIWQGIDLSLTQNEKIYEYTDSIYAGANNSGTPWTQYCCWGQTYRENLTDTKKKEAHYLFWRVDCHTARGKQEPEYYLALQHYDGYAHRKETDEASRKANSRKAVAYESFRTVCDKLRQNYSGIIDEIGYRASYKESDLIFIPVRNLKKLDGSIEEISMFLKNITDTVRQSYI